MRETKCRKKVRDKKTADDKAVMHRYDVDPKEINEPVMRNHDMGPVEAKCIICHWNLTSQTVIAVLDCQQKVRYIYIYIYR